MSSQHHTDPRNFARRLPDVARSLGFSTWLPSWPWLLGLAAFGRTLASATAVLHDPDTYLHIAAGRAMLINRGLPTADLWSHSMAGAPWVPSEWLGEIVFALAYAVDGWGGVITVTAATFGLAVGLLASFFRRRVPPLPVAIVSLAAAMLVLPHLLARPHVLALPVLVIWSGSMIAARDDERGPPWAMLPVMALWANLHGSFMFGLALAAFVGAEAALRPAPGESRWGEIRRWGFFIAGAIGMSLCTPNGVYGLLQPLRLVTMPALQAGFIEWGPADLIKFPALAVWLAAAVIVAGVVRPRVAWTRLMLLLGLVYMALSHVRHADLLAIVGPLAVAAGLGRTVARILPAATSSVIASASARLAQPAGYPARILVLALVATIGLPVLLWPPVRSGDAVTPSAALATAREMGLSGPVFNSEAYGGYLVFAGIPVFIDGRIEMYGNDFLAAYLAADGGDATALTSLLGRYRIGWSLLQAKSPAVAVLDRMPGWRRAYSDGQAVIHVRAD